MRYLTKQTRGTALKDIIASLGNKSYKRIICRCKWTDSRGDYNDDIISSCTYDEQKGLKSSINKVTMDDLFTEWKESDENDGPVLTVWGSSLLMHNS